MINIFGIFNVLSLFYMSKVMAISMCTLPNGCQLKRNEYLGMELSFVCEHINSEFGISFRENELNRCSKILYSYLNLEIYFRSSRPIIFDKNFDFEGFYQVYSQTLLGAHFKLFLNLVFEQISGFDIDSFKHTDEKLPMRIEVSIYDSSLDFYSRNKKIRSCEDYLNGLGENLNFFQACSFPCQFSLRRFKFKTPICPLALNNSDIHSFKINRLIDTFYKANTIRFLDLNSKNKISFNSIIREFELMDVDNISIDKRLLQPDVFENMRFFQAFGRVAQIQEDLFALPNFPRLEIFEIGLQFFKPLVHKQGIGWIEAINSDLNIDLSVDLEFIKLSRKKICLLTVDYISSVIYLFQKDDVNFYFPNEDFCLYVSFPFHQLVFFQLSYSNQLANVTCTLFWLLRYHPKFFPLEYNNNIHTINRCNFKEMISNCNRSNRIIPKSDEESLFDVKAAMIVWQFISMVVASPLICLVGILGNILVVCILIKKDNSKQELKEKQYDYMKLKSIANCLILFFQIFSLLSDCQPNNSGIYCSSLRKLIGVQYFKIVFNEFFCNYLRFVSNLFHIAFSVNRLSLIRKDTSNFNEYVSRLRVRNFVIFSSLLGLIVTFAKGLRLRANLSNFEFETLFVYTDNNRSGIVGIKLAITILNCLCDLLNGPVFFLFCVVIDLQLVVALKQTTDEKLAKLESMMTKSNFENIHASLKNTVFRAIVMVAVNSLVNLMLKIPSTIISILDLIRFIVRYRNSDLGYDSYLLKKFNDPFFPYLIFFIKCEFLNSCQAFEEFAKCLFMLSIGIDVYFYYKFDIRFKLALLNFLGIVKILKITQ